MSAEVHTEPVAPNGAGETTAGEEKPRAETFEFLQKMENHILRTLSKRSRPRRLWAKIWKRKPPELLEVYGIIHNHLIEIQRLFPPPF